MPQIPRRGSRVVCRYSIRRVDNTYWGVAFDQGGSRYPEADFTNEEREKAREIARGRVNNAYTVPTNEGVSDEADKRADN